MSRPVRCMLVALAFGACAATAHAAAPKKVRTYTVQPGDSIWSIAAEFYGNGDKYKLIYKHNTFIGLAPYILKPGQVLTLPEGEVSPEAQVAWMKKEVRAKPPRSLDWLDASARMNLWKQYQVSTGDESAVHIVFEDASNLSLGDNALLVIYGGSARGGAKVAKSRERTKTQVLLREGTVRGGLGALDGTTQPMQVETPSGILDVNATEMQIQCDATESVISVYEGEVDVKAGGQTVKVPQDHGTVVEKNKKPEAPRPLPPPPGWSIEGQAVAIVPAGGKAVFEASWSPVDSARSYRIELAEDERFKNIAVSVEVDAKTTHLVLEKVPVGRFYARVSAKDLRKLQGRPSKALMLDVVGINSSRRMSQDEDGRWEVQGFARLDLGQLGEGLEWSLDDQEFITGSVPKRVLGEGAHAIKVRRAGETLTTTFPFHVLAIRGQLDLGGKERLHAGTDETRTLTLTVTDERGRPAAVPDVVMQIDPGGMLPVRPTGPGVFVATLPAPAAPGPREILVRAAWPDGVLGRGLIEVERKLLEPYVYRWRESVDGLTWDGRGAATALPSVPPIDRIGTETGYSRRNEEPLLNIALRGEWSLLDGDLGLDGALTAFRLPLSGDTSAGNELGDLVLGARYLALREKRVTIAPSFRARAPLGRKDHVGAGLEPSLLLRFRAAETLWLDTRQGLFASLGSAGDTTYIGDYAVVWMPMGLYSVLGLSAQLGTAVSFDDAPFAAAAGLGAYLHLDRIRLGFELGFGLGDGGTTRYGDVTGGITLDFGLGTP